MGTAVPSGTTQSLRGIGRRRYKQQWEPLYLQEQRNRYAESGDEALMMMRGLLRSENEKSQLKAGEIILKCGPHLAMAKNAPTSQTYEKWEWARYQQYEAEERKRLDGLRARRGLPPATESEFLIELEDERRIRDGLPLIEKPDVQPKSGVASAPRESNTHGESSTHDEMTQPRSPVSAGIVIGLLLFLALGISGARSASKGTATVDFAPARSVSKEAATAQSLLTEQSIHAPSPAAVHTDDRHRYSHRDNSPQPLPTRFAACNGHR